MAANNIKVLLLEDDTAHAEAIRRALRATRYKVRVAGTLREYRDSVAADPPDVAILDMFLPDGGVMEILSSQQQSNRFPLIVMTSQGNEQHAVDAMKAGAQDYIVKSPEAFADMPGIIIHAMDHWKLMQERKWAEEALRRSEYKFRNVVEKANDVIVIIQDGIISFSNPRITALLGYEVGKIEGMDFVSLIPPENSGLILERYHKRMAGEKLSERYEIELLHKSGRKVPVETSGSLIEYAGKPADLVIIRDITERRQAEERLQESELRYRDLVNNSKNAVVIYEAAADGEDFIIRDFNSAAENVEKVKKEDIIGKSVLLVFPGVKEYGFFDVFQRVWRTGVPERFPITQYRDQRISGWRDSYVYRLSSGEIVAIYEDITARKQAEQALQVSEEKYRVIFNNEIYGICIFDLETLKLLDVNDAYCRIYGYNREELLSGMTIHDITAEHQVSDAATRQAVNEGTIFIPLRYHRKKDGAVFPVEIVGGPYVWQERKVMFALMHDITNRLNSETERKKAELALLEVNERIKLALEASRSGTWDWDMVTGHLAWSDEQFRIFGLDPSRDTASFETWRAMLHPDERQAAEDRINESIRDHVRLNNQYRIILPSGEVRWIEAWGDTIYDSKGVPKRMNGICIDVTERKRADEDLQASEERLLFALDSIEAGAWDLDLIGHTAYRSLKHDQIFGYEAMLPQWTFEMFLEHVVPEDRADVDRKFQQAIESKSDWNFECRIIRRDGEQRWIIARGRHRLDSSGQPRRMAGIVQDITDRKSLEEERQRVEKLESVGLLAGGIAHDFNNILTSILGNISLAAMDAAPGSELKNNLEQAQKASLRARGLAAQLLTFAKGGAPVMKLASLTELLREAAGFALTGSKVKCRFTIPADLWHAEIDAGQVSQVIHNLVLNAQQSMPNGGTIELTAENMALSETQGPGRGLPVTAGNYVRIAVTDHGSGIPVENMQKIFDPFFSTKQKGSGLGLATSFSIARRHGGHISVESEVGAGSTFYFYLPASTQTAVAKQDKKEGLKAVGKARILVMDDEQGIRTVAGRMLRHIGYEDVEFAEHGEEAIKLYKAAMETGKPFDLAILDLTIAGGMGGEIAMQNLLQIDPGIKAIVSSGYMDDSVIVKFKDHGFSGVMSKPYTIEELRKAVQHLIG